MDGAKVGMCLQSGSCQVGLGYVLCLCGLQTSFFYFAEFELYFVFINIFVGFLNTWTDSKINPSKRATQH